MNSKQLKMAMRISLGVGVLLFLASVTLSWGKDDSLLSSTLFWVGFVMILLPGFVGARGTNT